MADIVRRLEEVVRLVVWELRLEPAPVAELPIAQRYVAPGWTRQPNMPGSSWTGARSTSETPLMATASGATR